MNTLIAFSLKHRILMLVAFALTMIGGLVGFNS